MNEPASSQIKLILTVAGSDSGAGAGLQADLRIFSHLGLYGLSAVTAVTAQSSLGVVEVFPMHASQLSAQLEALLADREPAVTKTGMLATEQNLEVVAGLAAAGSLGRLVVDPVLGATAGAGLAEPALAAALARRLVPLADLVTPNLAEAAMLTGITVENQEQAAAAATALVEMGAGAACVTGGHLAGDPVDVLHDGLRLHHLGGKRLRRGETLHGTGCLFSAAAASYLALGKGIPAAVQSARELTAAFIRAAVRPGQGMAVPWPPA